MRSETKTLLIIAVILAVFAFLAIGNPLLAPVSGGETIGCSDGQQDPMGNPPPPREPPYGNCVVDGLALLNEKEFGDKVDEAQLRSGIMAWMRKKGYKMPSQIGLNEQGIKDAIKCKETIMEV